MRNHERISFPKMILLGLVGIGLGGCSPQASTPKPEPAKQNTSQDETAQESAAVDPANEPSKSETKSASGDSHKAESMAKLPSAGYQFETPVRLEAGGEPISVESPGYACPTMADVDGDGKLDLVVGQFKDGNMQFCRNIADENEIPKFAKPQWLMTGDVRAVVPGVW